MDNLPDHYFTTNNSFTHSVYRDVYPAVDPKSPALSQAGKVVMITGASRGIGKQVRWSQLIDSPMDASKGFVNTPGPREFLKRSPLPVQRESSSPLAMSSP